MSVVDSVEALLFVAEAPASIDSLAAALQLTEGQIEQAIEVLARRMADTGPLHVVKLAGGYQLATKPEYSQAIANFLKPSRQRLSRSLMEVLAVVAYRQPLTISDIDLIRGVQSDYSVKALLERRLIQEVGRRHALGRPMLYGTSQQFLHQFKLHDLAGLPALESVTQEELQLSLPAPLDGEH